MNFEEFKTNVILGLNGMGLERFYCLHGFKHCLNTIHYKCDSLTIFTHVKQKPDQDQYTLMYHEEYFTDKGQRKIFSQTISDDDLNVLLEVFKDFCIARKIL